MTSPSSQGGISANVILGKNLKGKEEKKEENVKEKEERERKKENGK
jgi:hypothetical protein